MAIEILQPVKVQDLTELTAQGFFSLFGSNGDALALVANLDNSVAPYRMKISELVKVIMVKSNALIEVGWGKRLGASHTNIYDVDGVLVREMSYVDGGHFLLSLSTPITPKDYIVIGEGNWYNGWGGFVTTDFSAAPTDQSFSSIKVYSALESGRTDNPCTVRIFKKITSIDQL